MIKKVLGEVLQTLLWFTIATVVCVSAWIGLEYSIFGAVERRPWDILGYLVCVFISRRFAECMTREK